MKVLYIYRCPDLGFSIGRVFHPIEREMRKYASVDSFYLPVANYSIRGLITNIFAIHKFLKTKHYDIIHITGTEHYLLPFLIGRKTVVTVHDLAFVYRHKRKWSYFIKYILFVKSLKFATFTTFISKKTESETLSVLKIDKYKTIYNPVDNDFKYSPKVFNKDCPRILHIGTRPQKNLARTIEALAGIPCKLRIIGKITSLEKQRMQDLGITYSSEDKLSDEEIIEEYKKCDIVNFPSTYEGYGMPIVEGQATGRIVLTSGLQPMNEISGNAAILVAPASVDSIRQGYLTIINDDFLREEIIKKGRENIERFNLNAVVEEYYSLYKNILSSTHKYSKLTSIKKSFITIVFRCLTYISNKMRHGYIDFTKLKVCQACSNNLQHISSSNNIIVFNENKKNLFFKECRQHIKFEDYMQQSVTDYFKYICGFKKKDLIKAIIETDIKNIKNKKRLSRLDKYCYSHYDCTSIYTGWNTNNIGLPTLSRLYNEGGSIDVILFMTKFFPDFLKYIRNEVSNYNFSKYLRYGELQTFRCSHSISTKKMADLLGLSDMIPRTEYVKLIIDGKDERIGMIVEESPGICPLLLDDDEKKKITPEFQHQLLNLHIFDTICFQRDHKQENYFVIRNEKGLISGLSAFDNDSPQTFLPIPIIKYETSMRCSPIVDNTNEYNRPYIDKTFAENIISVNFNDIKELLYHDISSFQIYMLCKRIKKMQDVIRRLEDKRKIDKAKWTQDTMQEELGGKYGNTYLKHYMEVDENALVAKIMNGKSI